MIFCPPSKVLCGGPGSAELIREHTFSLSVTGPPGELDDSDPLVNALLRGVQGIGFDMASDAYAPNNTAVPTPVEKGPTPPVTLTYVMADHGMSRKIINFWTDWRDKVYSYEDDTVGLYGDIVGTARVKVWGIDGKSAVMEFKLWEVWPSSISIPSLDREQAGTPLKVTVTLQVAYVELVSKPGGPGFSEGHSS